MNNQVTSTRIDIKGVSYDGLHIEKYSRILMDPLVSFVLRVMPEGQACLNTIHGCATWQAMWRNSILLTMSKFLFLVYNHLQGVTLEIGLDSDPRALL